jgi:predicted ATPase/DNA-binding XRE family transcriptional regulator
VTFAQLLRRLRIAAALTQEELAERAELTPRGLAYLEAGKRTPHRETIRRLVEALGLDPEQQAALQAAARGADRDAAAVPHPLSVALTPIVGRGPEESVALDALRRSEVRLLTLTGTGGVGKTRLAQRLVERVAPEFADGVVTVALETIRDPELVSFAIGRALGVREEHGRRLLQAVVNRLRDSQLLLLLDNFEQVVQAGPLLLELLSSAPGLKALVTSRAPLKIPGEHELMVLPLALPDPGATRLRAIERSSAVELFLQRARAVRHDFALTEANAPAAAEVCRRLDGLPLAIELAAARMRLLSVQQLATRLNTGLQFIDSSTTHGRHHTLRATLDWSHDLLSETERVLFARVAVFAGGWTLEAAEAVGIIPGTV